MDDAHEYVADGVLVHNCDAARYCAMHLDGGFSGTYEAPQQVPPSDEPSPVFRTLDLERAPRIAYGDPERSRVRRGGRLFGGPAGA